MTRIKRCDDKNCKCYGKEYVDRGYGYPVCPSNNWPLNPEDIKLMDKRYGNQYNTE